MSSVKKSPVEETGESDVPEAHLVWNEPGELAQTVQKWWNKKSIRWAFWIVLIAVGGFVLIKQKPGPKVRVVTPTKRDVIELIIATGRIRSKETSTIGAEIAGIVSQVYVTEGARVKRGQKLARLVQTDISHRLRQARLSVRTAERMLVQASQKPLASDLAVAKANVALATSRYQQAFRSYTRGKRLFKSRSISQAELDKFSALLDQSRASMEASKASYRKLLSYPRQADVAVVKARVLEAKAGLHLLRNQASKRLIRAPFAGIIASRRLAVGQVVAPGSPLFILASTERTEVFAETDENNLPKLRRGQSAMVVASAYKHRSFRAVLEQIGPIVDNTRGVVGLRLKPIELPSYVLLNMTVDINVKVAQWKQATSLPADTLVKRDGKNYVMVLEKGRIVRKAITLRGRNTDWIVCAGIPMDAKVIRRGHPMKQGSKARLSHPSPGGR